MHASIRKLLLMKMVSKLGLLLSVSILLLHSFMPHQHHSEISEERHSLEHKDADSILDYLLLAFHANLGENHLEEYQKASSIASCFVPSDQLMLELRADWVVEVDAVYADVEPAIHHLLLINQRRFRGPPQLV